ncbi:MAG: hypothetical protein II933_02630 [Candidatus Methanomethylophilaceae archaeon]|nr:hypothetical protein [Candidatus Methanomethylophilaceae archaeon]
MKWNMPHLTVTCKRCGYTWNSHNGTPKRCPQCGSHQWDVPPRVNHCLRCGNTWTSRSMAEPRRCPKCSSTEWYLDIPLTERPRRAVEVDEPVKAAVLERYDRGMSNLDIAIETGIPFSVVQSVVTAERKGLRRSLGRFPYRLRLALGLDVQLVLGIRRPAELHGLLVIDLGLLPQGAGLLLELLHLLVCQLAAVGEFHGLLVVVAGLGPGLSDVPQAPTGLHGVGAVVPLVPLAPGLARRQVVVIAPVAHVAGLVGQLLRLVLELVALVDQDLGLPGVLVPGGLVLDGVPLGIAGEVLHGPLGVVLGGHPFTLNM